MSGPSKTLESEIITVPSDTDEVFCDGGGGTLGHPVVWYVFDGQKSVECGYCDRAFVKKRAEATFRHKARQSA